MKGYKVIIHNKSTSERVQKHAFKLGYTWFGGPEVSCTDKNFLFFNTQGVIGWDNNDTYYLRNSCKAISAMDFLELTPPKDSIDITIKVNGKEISLKDISEETLLAIRKEC